MRYDIGIDLGGTNIVVGVVDELGVIIRKLRKPTDARRGAVRIIDDMAKMSLELLSVAGVSISEIGSVGVGVPGTANTHTGVVDYATNLDWKDVPLADMLCEKTGKPVYIGNDANAAAFGEYTAGAAHGFGSALAVTLGTGIGGGMVLDGKIIGGFNCAGMEIGHIVIREGGRPCACGRHGCWERYASATGLIITTREAMSKVENTKLHALTEGKGDAVTGRTAFDAMRNGDAVATEVVNTYINDLACGVTNLINVLQPEIMCFGGGVANEGETLLAPLREKVMAEVYSRGSALNTKIVKAKLGNDAGIIGAAHMYRIEE